MTFFWANISLPLHKKQKEMCFGNYKNVLFLYSNYTIIENVCGTDYNNKLML